MSPPPPLAAHLTQGRTYFHPIAPKLICCLKRLQSDFFLGLIPWPDLGAQNVCRMLSRSHPGSDLIRQLYLFMVTPWAGSSGTECSGSTGRRRWDRRTDGRVGRTVPPPHARARLNSCPQQVPFLCLLCSKRSWAGFPFSASQSSCSQKELVTHRYTLNRLPQAE